jgi:hypothetical protein
MIHAIAWDDRVDHAFGTDAGSRVPCWRVRQRLDEPQCEPVGRPAPARLLGSLDENLRAAACSPHLLDGG